MILASTSSEIFALCLTSDKSNKTVSLGSFLLSPHKTNTGNDIRLVYTNGSFCAGKMSRIQTILTLKCKPGRLSYLGWYVCGYKVAVTSASPLYSRPLTGDLESAPVLRSVSSDGCLYELEWYTAAACVLSKTQGDDCKVEDAQAGKTHNLGLHGFSTKNVFLDQGEQVKDEKDLFGNSTRKVNLPSCTLSGLQIILFSYFIFCICLLIICLEPVLRLHFFTAMLYAATYWQN